MNKKGRFELPYKLAVSDGTNEIDLTKTPFALIEWKPAISPYKSGGTFSESPLAHGRKLIDSRRDNIKDSISISLGTFSQDQNIKELRDLRALLQKAIDFWVGWQSTPVYLIAQSSRETNIRYAHIYTATIPEDNYLYGQPFVQPNGSSLQVDLVIEIEHTEWLSMPPGTGECMPLKLVTNQNSQAYIDKILLFDPVGAWKLNELSSAGGALNYSEYGASLDGTWEGGVNILYDDAPFTNNDTTNFVSLGGNYYIDLFTSGGAATLDALFELLNGTIVFWQYNTGVIWTSGFTHGMFSVVIDSDNYIKVYKSTVDYQIRCEFKAGATSPAYTINFTVPSLTSNAQWIPIAITWEPRTYPATNSFVRLFVSGKQVGGTVALGQLSGALTQFLAANTDTGANDSLSGNISYAQYYNKTLTPAQIAFLSAPQLPVIDETSCEQNVHFANKHTYAPLTHLFVYDASAVTYTANLLNTALPYNLLPASSGAGDILYAIIDSTTGNPLPSGQFSNIVFDIISGTGYTLTRQYWNGAAWTALTGQDNTNELQTNDVHAAIWELPATQATTTVNGITGWIVRWLVSAPTGGYVAPQQQNRHPYTVTWPYIQINEEDVGGDIPALARYLISNVSLASTATPSINTLHTNKIIAGLRSLSRGANFTAYLNISDRQLAQGTSVTLGSNTSYVNNFDGATGRCVQYSSATVQPMQTEVTVTLNSAIAPQYLGKYKLLLRATPFHTSYSAYCQIKISLDSNVVLFTTEKKNMVVLLAAQRLLDFGRITIGEDILLEGDISNQLQFEIQIQNTFNSSFIMNFFEIILIPIDEWSIGTSAINQNLTDNEGASLAGEDYALDIDSIINPKYSPRSLLRNSLLSNAVTSRYKVSSPGDAIVQANSDQRLWVVSSGYSFDASGTEVSKPVVVNTVRAEMNQRYRSARGGS